MLVKTIKITNPKNTVLQIPAAIMSKWGLTDNDSILMTLQDGHLILSPQKGHYGN